MKRNALQSYILQIIYKGIFKGFLRVFIGVHFSDNRSLKDEEQFIIIANHNSHLDTLSIMASLPKEIIWKVKPVAAQDYFGSTKFKERFSNYFINTLLIDRKKGKDPGNNPIKKMLSALDEGYSLLLFPEGTRGDTEIEMGDIKPGIALLLSARPHIKYIPVYMSGMGHSLPKGSRLPLPYKSTVNYGKPTSVAGLDVAQIIERITADFKIMEEQFQTYKDETDD